MSQFDQIKQLLDDMDIIRPIVIAASPDDKKLRSMTRNMVSALEHMWRNPGVSLETHLWTCRQLSKFADTEHAILLRPLQRGRLPESVRQPFEQHIKQRYSLLQQAQQELPATHRLLDSSSALIGKKACSTESLPNKARHLQKLLKEHLKKNSSFRTDLQQLIDAINNSFSAISDALEQAGEDSQEFKQTRRLLEQELPEDIEQAREVLQVARQGILNAGNTLATAGAKLQNTMQGHVEQLSTLSSKLKKAESDARNDPLTGLANRRRIAELLKNMARNSYSFLIIDIDFFKKINDSFGHDAGDEVLIQLAGILSECIRATDFSARVGGEEFCIIFPDTNLEISTTLAESLRQAIEIFPFKTKLGRIDVTVSMGVAEHKPGTPQARTFKAADQALYQSKNNGRNRVTAASSDLTCIMHKSS